MYRDSAFDPSCSRQRFVDALRTARTDGRALTAARPEVVDTHVAPGAVGSCVARHGGTTVSCVIHAQCAPPLPGAESVGYLAVTVTSPFRGAEPTAGTALRNQCAALACAIQGALTDSGAYPWDALCLVPREAVYILHMELSTLADDGSVADVALHAATAALAAAGVPAMHVVDGALLPAKGFVPWHVDATKVPRFVSFGVFFFGGAATDDTALVAQECTSEEERFCDVHVRVLVAPGTSPQSAAALLGVTSVGAAVPPKTLWECVRRAREAKSPK